MRDGNDERERNSNLHRPMKMTRSSETAQSISVINRACGGAKGGRYIKKKVGRARAFAPIKAPPSITEPLESKCLIQCQNVQGDIGVFLNAHRLIRDRVQPIAMVYTHTGNTHAVEMSGYNIEGYHAVTGGQCCPCQSHYRASSRNARVLLLSDNRLTDRSKVQTTGLHVPLAQGSEAVCVCRRLVYALVTPAQQDAAPLLFLGCYFPPGASEPHTESLLGLACTGSNNTPRPCT